MTENPFRPSMGQQDRHITPPFVEGINPKSIEETAQNDFQQEIRTAQGNEPAKKTFLQKIFSSLTRKKIIAQDVQDEFIRTAKQMRYPNEAVKENADEVFYSVAKVLAAVKAGELTTYIAPNGEPSTNSLTTESRLFITELANVGQNNYSASFLQPIVEGIFTDRNYLQFGDPNAIQATETDFERHLDRAMKNGTSASTLKKAVLKVYDTNPSHFSTIASRTEMEQRLDMMAMRTQENSNAAEDKYNLIRTELSKDLKEALELRDKTANGKENYIIVSTAEKFMKNMNSPAEFKKFYEEIYREQLNGNAGDAEKAGKATYRLMQKAATHIMNTIYKDVLIEDNANATQQFDQIGREKGQSYYYPASTLFAHFRDTLSSLAEKFEVADEPVSNGVKLYITGFKHSRTLRSDIDNSKILKETDSLGGIVEQLRDQTVTRLNIVRAGFNMRRALYGKVVGENDTSIFDAIKKTAEDMGDWSEIFSGADADLIVNIQSIIAATTNKAMSHVKWVMSVNNGIIPGGDIIEYNRGVVKKYLQNIPKSMVNSALNLGLTLDQIAEMSIPMTMGYAEFQKNYTNSIALSAFSNTNHLSTYSQWAFEGREGKLTAHTGFLIPKNMKGIGTYQETQKLAIEVEEEREVIGFSAYWKSLNINWQKLGDESEAGGVRNIGHLGGISSIARGRNWVMHNLTMPIVDQRYVREKPEAQPVRDQSQQNGLETSNNRKQWELVLDQDENSMVNVWKSVENNGIPSVKVLIDEFTSTDLLAYENGRFKNEAQLRNFSGFLYERFFSQGVGRAGLDNAIQSKEAFWKDLQKQIAGAKNDKERAKQMQKVMQNTFFKALSVLTFRQAPNFVMDIVKQSREQNGITIHDQLMHTLFEEEKELFGSTQDEFDDAWFTANEDFLMIQTEKKTEVRKEIDQHKETWGNLYGHKDLNEPSELSHGGYNLTKEEIIRIFTRKLALEGGQDEHTPLESLRNPEDKKRIARVVKLYEELEKAVMSKPEEAAFEAKLTQQQKDQINKHKTTRLEWFAQLWKEGYLEGKEPVETRNQFDGWQGGTAEVVNRLANTNKLVEEAVKEITNPNGEFRDLMKKIAREDPGAWSDFRSLVSKVKTTVGDEMGGDEANKVIEESIIRMLKLFKQDSFARSIIGGIIYTMANRSSSIADDAVTGLGIGESFNLSDIRANLRMMEAYKILSLEQVKKIEKELGVTSLEIFVKEFVPNVLTVMLMVMVLAAIKEAIDELDED